MHGRLEDLDYAGDVCLLSQSCRGMSEKICNLQAEAAGTGLKINSKETKELRINSKITTNINVNNVVIESVEQFTYLDNVVTVDGGTRKDVQARVRKAHTIFVELYPLLKITNILMTTKIRIDNSNVKSILLCGCETWEGITQITNNYKRLLTEVCEEW